MRICDIEGCTRKHVARGMCCVHYNRKNYTPEQQHPKVVVPCAACGTLVEKYPSSRYRPTCSDACKYELTYGYRKENKPEVVKVPKVRAPRVDQRGPLRKAIDSGDGAGIIAAVRSRCLRTEAGCWIWSGKLKAGYPTVTTAGKAISVHRLTLEARLGMPLGKQAAHHICATPACVNPDHLQPVTAAANTAEMLARTYMVDRIEQLEVALRSLDPTHPALAEVSTSLAS